MIQIICEISNKKHKGLIEWLFTKCDMFTFAVPDFSKPTDLLRNESCSDEAICCFGECSEEEKQDIIDYNNKVAEKIAPIKKCVLKNYFDAFYCGFCNGYEKEIFIVEFNNDTKDFLIQTDNLCLWTYPDMPEDVCFFGNGKCFMRTVAHEKLMLIYDDGKDTRRSLRNMGIKFRVDIDEPIPLLPRTCAIDFNV